MNGAVVSVSKVEGKWRNVGSDDSLSDGAKSWATLFLIRNDLSANISPTWNVRTLQLP